MGLKTCFPSGSRRRAREEELPGFPLPLGYPVYRLAAVLPEARPPVHSHPHTLEDITMNNRKIYCEEVIIEQYEEYSAVNRGCIVKHTIIRNKKGEEIARNVVKGEE